jgi:hypothetical protein
MIAKPGANLKWDMFTLTPDPIDLSKTRTDKESEQRCNAGTFAVRWPRISQARDRVCPKGIARPSEHLIFLLGNSCFSFYEAAAGVTPPHCG